jgi:hypothetical protein
MNSAGAQWWGGSRPYVVHRHKSCCARTRGGDSLAVPANMGAAVARGQTWRAGAAYGTTTVPTSVVGRAQSAGAGRVRQQGHPTGIPSWGSVAQQHTGRSGSAVAQHGHGADVAPAWSPRPHGGQENLAKAGTRKRATHRMARRRCIL